MTIEQERKNVLKEMLVWIPHDPSYVYTLNVYALQQGWITEEEAKAIKETLDNHYEITHEEDRVKNKYMLEIFKKIGMTYTKVLWRLIEQFPKFIVEPVEDFTFVAHDDSIIKQIGIDSISYYKIINDLCEKGYISKVKKDKKHCYKIHFDFIKATATL